MAFTFYWHDYETWGTNPRCDRAVQFAGVRTDQDLNPLGNPLVLFSKPADDMLPHPEAALVTGLTPQRALAEGVCEAEFMAAIHEELARPGTCGVGYNSIRFDDEFTRYGFYRNFIDAYGREWQNGNSRWDLIDMVRLTRALRPEGIEWPTHEDGSPSFRLEELTAANGISHAEAHDALSDVHATIAMARLIRERQSRLYDYLFNMRNKQKIAAQLSVAEKRPVLHVSSKYPASQGCIAMVVPVAKHPVNKNGIIVYDLRHDPRPLFELGAEEIRERLFTPKSELPEGVERIPLKTIHINKCPVIVPMNTLTESAVKEWAIDVETAQRHLEMIHREKNLESKIQAAHAPREFDQKEDDPDQALYGGGFFSDRDRRQIETVRAASPDLLKSADFRFEDSRLPELLFRYRARNWPQTLDSEEKRRWEDYRMRRLSEPELGGISLDQYREKLARMMVEPGLGERERGILSELADWPDSIL
jgi:exodeoxyribonuclease-1